jgi:hypothetical protein
MYIEKYKKYKNKYLSLKNDLYGGTIYEQQLSKHNITNFIYSIHKLLLTTTIQKIKDYSIGPNSTEVKNEFTKFIEPLFFLTDPSYSELQKLINTFEDIKDFENFKSSILNKLEETTSQYNINTIPIFNQYFDSYESNDNYEDEDMIIKLRELINKIETVLTDDLTDYNTLDIIRTIRDQIFKKTNIFQLYTNIEDAIFLLEFILDHLMCQAVKGYYINIILSALIVIVKKIITIIKNNLKYEYKQQHKNEDTLFFTTLINFSKGLRYTSSYLNNMSSI